MLITGVIQNLHPASLLPHTLTQIITCMTSASAGKEGDGNVRLADFSGHYTVISSIFAALGVYQGDLCVWPSYASTIIFELWLRNFGALIWPTESYVRVIYIPACKDEQEKREKYNRRSVLAARDGKSSGQFTFTLCHLRGGVLDGSMRL